MLGMMCIPTYTYIHMLRGRDSTCHVRVGPNPDPNPDHVFADLLACEHALLPGLEWEWLIGAAFVTGFIGALFVVLMSDPASK